jgi:hypothetical protein
VVPFLWGFVAGVCTTLTVLVLAGRALRQRRLQQAQGPPDRTPQQALRETEMRIAVLTWRRSSWPHHHIPEA